MIIPIEQVPPGEFYWVRLDRLDAVLEFARTIGRMPIAQEAARFPWMAGEA